MFRICGVGVVNLGGIKSMYVDSLICVKVKEVSDRFRRDSGMKQE